MAEKFVSYSHSICLSNGKVKELLLRSSSLGCGFIDQITFSFHEESILSSLREKLKDQYDCPLYEGLNPSDEKIDELARNSLISGISDEITSIFGFGVSYKRNGKGNLFYEETYSLGIEEFVYGTLHVGGIRQRGTVTIEMTGTGCLAAKEGWEERLYQFLMRCIRPKITRIDIAHDFLDGSYSPDQAVVDFDNGLFSRTNRTPKSECYGTDWRSHDNTGKTFYVGSRKSSKYVRVYEKGKQLGDKQSVWTRFEIEFKARDCVIPIEVLLSPSEYLAGAYPVCQKIFADIEKVSLIEIRKKKFDLTESKMIEWLKKQIGTSLNYFIRFKHLTAFEVIELLLPSHNRIPARLDPLSFSCLGVNYEQYGVQYTS